MAASPRPPSIFDVYSIRMMLGWVTSLGLILGLVHLPVSTPIERVGWKAPPSPERIALQEVRSESTPKAPSEQLEDAPPATQRSSAQSEAGPTSPADLSENRTETSQNPSGDSSEASSSDVRSMASLNAQDRIPEIVGGMGTLYLNIDYPKKARDQGIEGTLQLEFTVETDGSATHIEVVDSLHPLCDSAAVAGVRSVQFAPAKHNGTPVPVRMKLPVRFELLSTPVVPKTADTNS